MDIFSEKKILTVSQLTSLVRNVIEENFAHVWVEGEVSNLATPSSGHLYFTLKDAGAAIRCVMFRGAVSALKFRLADGMKLILRGRLSVYDQRGDYQLIAEYLEPQGVGALQLAFQQLKERLAKEGLFAESRKKPLPQLPQKIAVVTSPTGAAIHDILNVINRRYANLQILVYPVRVQGEGAAQEIAEAIRQLNRYAALDVILVARGGGSIEDLWAFNEEVVARAIVASAIPIIAAIGHETDITIADLAADLRAPTPSAAAEMVVLSKAQLAAEVNNLSHRLAVAVKWNISAVVSRFTLSQRALKGPGVVLEHLAQRVDDLLQRLDLSLAGLLARNSDQLKSLRTELFFKSPQVRIVRLRERLDNLVYRGDAAINRCRETLHSSVAVRANRLEALSPLAILGRGYAVAQQLPGKELIRSAKQLRSGNLLLLTFADGQAECLVEKVMPQGPEKLD